MRTGIRLAIDFGSARIGVARCDPDGLLASPLVTVAGGALKVKDEVKISFDMIAAASAKAKDSAAA